MKKLIVSILAAMLLFAVVGPANAGVVRNQTIKRINTVRVANHRVALKQNAVLNRIAYLQAIRCAKRGYISHVGFTARFAPYRAICVGSYLYGECLYWGTDGIWGTPHMAVYQWMHSPAHRRVLLHRDVREMGIYVRHSNGIYWYALAVGHR